MPLAGVRGALRAECGVPGTGGESVGFTTPGEDEGTARAGDPLELAPCTGELIAGDDMLLVCFLTNVSRRRCFHKRRRTLHLPKKASLFLELQLETSSLISLLLVRNAFPTAASFSCQRPPQVQSRTEADGRAREVKDDAWVPPRAAWWWERLEPGREGRTELLEGPSAWSRRAGNLDCKFRPVLKQSAPT